MGIFSSNKNKDELILVFNIGSSSVGGALFLKQKSGIPKIIFSIEEPIRIEEKINVDRFLFLTIQSLETVANKIYAVKMGAPSRIFCVLSSPWHVSQTRIINLKKNTPFIFTAKLADSLIQKEINLFEEEYPIKNKNTDKTVRIIELKNIKTILNGYEISQPLDKKIKELEMILFISISEEQILKEIENTIGKYFHFKQIKFSSFTMTSFTAIRDMYPQRENFLLVDIGGEVTDISMVKKNVLRESITFPLGHNFLSRGVASDLNCTLSEADSLISLLVDGHAEISEVKKLSLIVDKLKIEWLKKFQESLANISNDISIPAIIYMTVDEDLANFFCQTIKTEQFNQYTLTESKFEIFLLNTQTLHGVAMFEENTIRESSLILDSIYINRFLINSVTTG